MKTIHARPPRLGQHGVTLIELLIVIVIIGILAAIAIPSYRTYMIRTHRTEAKSALLQVQSNQERFYLDKDRYSDDVGDLGFDGGLSENGVYSLSLSTDEGWTQDYTATAAPTESGGSNDVNMSDDDECASFSITSQGERSATSANCW